MIYRILVNNNWAGFLPERPLTLTHQSLNYLKMHGVPADVLKWLEKIKGKTFPDPQALADGLEQTLGPKRATAYQAMICDAAEKGEEYAARKKAGFNCRVFDDEPGFRGAGFGELGRIMDQCRMWPRGRITNERGRFYFTELGWERVGRLVVAEARRLGYVVKVIKRKEPARSQIVYRDELQLCILPDRKGKQ